MKDIKMLTFKRYMNLNEDVSLADKFAKLTSISKYIVHTKKNTMFNDAVLALIEAAKTKEIYNARYNELKTTISNRVEEAYRSVSDTIVEQLKDSGVEETYEFWHLELNSIKKKQKLLLSFPVKPSILIEFINALVDIPDAFKELKKYVKSGRPPKEVKPGQFMKPMASLQATRIAKDYIEQGVATFRKRFEENTRKEILDTYEKIRNITDPALIPKNPGPMSIASEIFIVRGFGKNKTLELKKDSDSRVERYIADFIFQTINQFIAKNTSKISLIFQRKSGIRTHELLKTNFKNNMIENTMRFVFEDNSEFTLTSSVIYKFSSTGKLFAQFPTRFTNVILSDGSRMSMPSEEKMIKEF